MLVIQLKRLSEILIRNYFYKLLKKYISLYVLTSNTLAEIEPKNSLLCNHTCNSSAAFRDKKDEVLYKKENIHKNIISIDNVLNLNPDYILLGGLIHYERDIQHLFSQVYFVSHPSTRLILTYYSGLWSPLFKFASFLGIRRQAPQMNWLGHSDIKNLLELENFELIKVESKILFPFYIPIVSNLINRYLSPLPFLRNFNLVNIAIARPLLKNSFEHPPSVSIIVPARNEQGNIKFIVERIPTMGPRDEIIFVEGGSSDKTWDYIHKVKEEFYNKKIIILQQDGNGKGDAVRKGFSHANNEILMILDADMTVPPEDLIKFYKAIKSGLGEFINGSRLVYPMQINAMRFLNLLGNKFFAMTFSFVLGQPLKDTLCGTKVISRKNYIKLAANRYFFGDFDPFGDFDLIFGASRMSLKIVEIPIAYRERTYGQTNISRWRHGAILIAMLIFSARVIKFR